MRGLRIMTRTGDATTLSSQQRVRYSRLRMLADFERRVLTECPGDQALIAAEQQEPESLPRFAATSYPGSACWISLHDSRDQAAKHLASEAQGEACMAPGHVLDLDTGNGWSVWLTPIVTEWPAATVAQFAHLTPASPAL
jgi:hypothetical protein